MKRIIPIMFFLLISISWAAVTGPNFNLPDATSMTKISDSFEQIRTNEVWSAKMDKSISALNKPIGAMGYDKTTNYPYQWNGSTWEVFDAKFPSLAIDTDAFFVNPDYNFWGFKSVGIGTTTPDTNSMLEISGNPSLRTSMIISTHATSISQKYNQLSFVADAVPTAYLVSYSPAAGTIPLLELYNTCSTGEIRLVVNSAVYLFDNAGTATCISWTSTSDERLKKNIKLLEISGIDKLKNCHPISFCWNNTDETESIGFSAQEMEKIIPDAVHTARDELHTKSIDFTKVTTILWKAVQEQQERIEQLESALAGIDRRLKKIENQ